MASEIERRREFSQRRIGELRTELEASDERWWEVASVCVIGSLGRLEGSQNSDLDLVVISRTDSTGTTPRSRLSRLEETRLKARVIDVGRRLKFDELSNDGEFLLHHPAHELIGNIGKRDDDSSHTLTSRLLLLLESQPISGDATHQAILEQLIDAYWTNFEGREDKYVPGYFVNDIQRLWRTFCVNYEARTKEHPKEDNARRELKNYKLRHSRLMTCYSGLLHMMATYRKERTVSKDAALRMMALAPLDRISEIAELHADCKEPCDRLQDAYERFLDATSRPKADTIALILDDDPSALPDTGLNKAVFELVGLLGEGNKLHRMVVV